VAYVNSEVHKHLLRKHKQKFHYTATLNRLRLSKQGYQ